MEIKKFDVLQTGKVLGALYVILGLLIGIVVSIVNTSGYMMSYRMMDGGFIPIVTLPILYGLIGFVGGMLMAWLYNFVAKHIGGIKFN